MNTIKDILKYTIIAGLCFVPFIPFIVGGSFLAPAMLFPFITGKGFVFRILIEIIFALFVFLAIVEPHYRPKMSWITKSIALFIGVIFVADLFSLNPYKSFWSNYERMEGFVLLVHLCMYYIVASTMFQKINHWKNYFNVSIGASTIMALYGALQILGKVTINQGGVRVDATFGNATYLAIYLIFHIFLCLYFVFEKGLSLPKRWTYSAIIILQTIVLYYTATRGAILGLIGGVFVTGLVLAFGEKDNVGLRKKAYGAIAVLVLLIGSFFVFKNTAFVQKNPVLSRFASISGQELKTQGRYFVWPIAIKGFLERPILGYGQESFNFVFNKFYNPQMLGQEQWFDRTHNIILDWLIAGGILGLLAYLSLFASLFYYIWRRASHFSLPHKAVLTGMMIAYMFHNMFVFDNLVSYILFFSILGFVHSSVTEHAVDTRKFYTHQVSDTIAYGIYAPVITIVLVLGVYFVNTPAINASTTLIQAMSSQSVGGVETNFKYFKQVFAYNSFGSTEALEQLVQVSSQLKDNAQVPKKIQEDFYTLAKEQLLKKLDQTPNDTRYLVFAGSFFNRYGQYDDAIVYLDRALKTSPQKQTVMFELATSYLGKGDVPKALELMKQAYDLKPSAIDSKIIYATGAIYAKDGELLKKLYSELGNDTDTVLFDNRILSAYSAVKDYPSVEKILVYRLSKDPNNLNYQYSLAITYASMGQKQKAIDLLRAMIKSEPRFKDQGEYVISQILQQ